MRKTLSHTFLMILAFMFFVISAYAGESFQKTGFLEAGIRTADLTNGFQDWFGQYINGILQASEKNIWDIELVNDKRFGDTGQFISLGNTHIFNDLWYTNLNVGISRSGFWGPKQRLNFSVNKKWLSRKQLVTTVGYAHHIGHEGYIDNMLYANVSYYFTSPWIIHGGVRVYHSHPGSITTESQFVAITEGKDKHHYLTLRYDFGKEGYQLIGVGREIVNFSSYEIYVVLRQWVGKNWGFNIITDFYHNTFYNRKGISIGLFRDF